MSNHEIQKVLVLSTAHITEQTNNALLSGEVRNMVVTYADGYFIYAPASAVDMDDNMPGELKFLLGYARGLGCDWLRLDCDADTREDLPSWDW
jgi:hypothetical protein